MKALIISADLFEDSELTVPFHALLKAGLDIDIASFEKGCITGKHGLRLEARLSLEEVEPKYYDILILPGGKAPSALRKEPKALEIARYFFEQGKPVAAICHGPQILISAGLLKGREVTGYQSIKEELIEAGAIYKDEKVVIDRNLITSRTPEDLDEFMGAIRKCLRKLSG
ncbi:type 1 glutamine amidotransferase domain-containing protein [Sulfurovum mangrovi]|uniref:type 1 glutamine amidotransferase domain-containing protein n=1 Tax=Sulfurovum mangrovi TaxID=2893889 RepID=UPI001E2C1091|nr:type 1 glutamine amidotransferase domain-containing protein [Sulfurovum mangrovi]UFH58469.1 type 1 glutamine amidotransferase [Sulfurovum mangrovi]